MPPKQASESNLDPTASTLLLILAHQTELKMDNAALGPILGLKDGKNVGRKIDSMIKPYGYKYEKGKIVANHGTGTEATAKADVSKGGNSNEETPKSVKKAVKSKGKKRSASPEDGDDTPKAGKKLKTTKTKEAEEEPDATDASEAPELKEEDGEE